jgi:hypothetical protein
VNFLLHFRLVENGGTSMYRVASVRTIHFCTGIGYKGELVKNKRYKRINMMNAQFSKWVLAGVAVAALAGCQSSGGSAQTSAKKNEPEMVINPPGTKLGGGFTAGMTPQQACDVFNKYYKTSARHNNLCKKLNQDKPKNFSNVSVVNRKITPTGNMNQAINTMVFVFNEQGTLNLVMAVEDDTPHDMEQKQVKDIHEQTVRKYHY